MASETPLPKRILMFGATGVIGKYIISELYNARSSFEKIGFFTSPKTAGTKSEEVNDWRAKGIEVIIGDVNSEDDVRNAYQGAHLPSKHHYPLLITHRLRHRHFSTGTQRNSFATPSSETC
jgi:nucleoside-diphosphate-sugar epimerase